MESSDHNKPESSDPKAAPQSETEGRFSFASSSSTSSFNSIDNTNDEMELMEDDDDDDEENEVGGHNKKRLPPTSSSKSLTTPGTIGTTSSDDQLETTTTTDETYEDGAYDSNRIPSAVFSRKPTNRMEWSVASNESLFSIHMGNNSFSIGPDLMLPFEVNNDSNAPFGLPSTEEGVENSNTSSRMNSISSQLKEEDHSMIRQQPAAGTPVNPKKDDKNHSFEITHVPEPTIPLSTGGNYGDSTSKGTHTSTVSRESGTSSSSFAFPLLASESGTKKMSCATTPEQLQQPVTAIDEEADDEKSKSKSKSKSETAPEAAEESAAVTNPQKDGEKKSSWLSFLSCFTGCPSNCKKSNQGGCFSKGNEKADISKGEEKEKDEVSKGKEKDDVAKGNEKVDDN